MMLVKERLKSMGGSWFVKGASSAREIEVRLQGSADWKELWNAVTAHAAALNLRQVRLDVNAPSLHEAYHARWDHGHDDGEAPSLWRAEIPLTARGLPVGRLEIVGSPDREPVWVKIAALTDAVERAAEALPAWTVRAATPPSRRPRSRGWRPPPPRRERPCAAVVSVVRRV